MQKLVYEMIPIKSWPLIDVFEMIWYYEFFSLEVYPENWKLLVFGFQNKLDDQSDTFFLE